MATESVQVADEENISIFKELESYPWESDAEFQGGLTAILGSNSTPDRVRELTLRAQCFYISRKKNTTIDFDAYKAYLESRAGTQSTEPSATTTGSSDPTQSSDDAPSHTGSDLPSASNLNDPKNAPYPQSFADIVALITSGAPIPGIREIPDTLLTDQASKPVASKRRKPWEKDVDEETIQGGTGTFGDHRDTIVPQEYPIDT
ncbi:myb dna-binding domain protein [Rutstroemia sp. NJR-2017a WRK4]|nr:myb dna-binding domain protein [Rutstroemia sp. NJR-2017a WRK4]